MEKRLKDFFSNSSNYPHAVESILHLETHISDIFLTGKYAYKIKKNVRFEFLDFSTIEKRLYFCEREIFLNSRFAPELYEEIVKIVDHNGVLLFAKEGQAIEYAIRMKQLDKNSLFTQLLEQGQLSEELLIKVVRLISKFHSSAELKIGFWNEVAFLKLINDNLNALNSHSPSLLPQKLVILLEEMIRKEADSKSKLIKKRCSHFVKALHGDLHLRNIALLNGEPIIFDGIEFNDELCCCDVWADIAFLIMDFYYRDKPEFANLVTNSYLQETDDFEGLSLLRLYVSYRATVRAKISCIESDTKDTRDSRHSIISAIRHVELSVKVLTNDQPKLIAIGGFSGSGKSTVANKLAQQIQAIHISSDVVRKHIVGIPILEKAGQQAYTTETNELVYLGMLDRAAKALSYGYTVILDAVHVSEIKRQAVEAFAAEKNIPFLGVWCKVPMQTAKERVNQRSSGYSDADVNIVEKQYCKGDPPINWRILDTSLPLSESIETLQEHFLAINNS